MCYYRVSIKNKKGYYMKNLFVLFSVLAITGTAVSSGCQLRTPTEVPFPSATPTTTDTELTTPTQTRTVTATGTPTPSATQSGTPTLTATLTVTATATQTSTITPDTGSKSYDFEAGDHGWTSEGQAALNIWGWNSSAAHTGTGSFRMNCAFTTTDYIASVIKDFSSAPVNLKGKTFTMWVYVPSTLGAIDPPYATMLYMGDSTGWHSVNGPSLTASNTWQQVNISVPGVFSSEDNMYKVVFWIYKSDSLLTADWSGDVYVDDISW
jgi:hypothetical protein